MLKKIWQQHSFIIFILILALGLRLPYLNGSFWLDEAAQALESARPWVEQLQISGDFQPPLIHLLLFFALKISKGEWWLRTIAALIPGLITIWATYEVGSKLQNKKTGIFAALLLATSSFHIFYSQELRPYSLPAMWGVLSWLYLIKATRAKKISQKNWLGFTLTSILGLYSSYLYPFLYFAQLLWLVYTQPHFRRTTITNFSLASLSFVPWLPQFLKQLRVGQSIREQLPGWEKVVSFSQLKSPALVMGKFIFGVVDLELNQFYLSISVLLLLLGGYVFYLNRHFLTHKKFLQATKLLLVWLFIPALSAWLVSFFIPLIQPKRLLFLLPAVYLIFSLSISSFTSKKEQHLGTLLISLLLSLNLFGTLQYYLNPNYQRENWQTLYQEVLTHYDPRETILLFSYPAPFSPWAWYDQVPYPIATTGEFYLKNVSHLSEQIKNITDYRYILLFDYLRDLTDPDDQLRTELWSLGFHEINTLNYPQIGFVRVFSRNKPTAQL